MTQATWNVTKIIDHFGGVARMTLDLGLGNRAKVDQWKSRKSIPAEWLAVISATAKKKRISFPLVDFVKTEGTNNK